MNLSECMSGTTKIKELDMQRQNIDMLAVKQMKIAPIVFASHMEFFYSYKMPRYKLSERTYFSFSFFGCVGSLSLCTGFL